jgi:hypothetical protein
MLPTTFMAGMTLPLFTYVLLNKGSGESSIGRVYAANTIGAIVGVLFAVHIGLPFLGMKNLLVVGAALDIVLGLVLLMKFAESRWQSPGFAVASVAVFAVFVSTAFGPNFDRGKLASGVYRYKRADVYADEEFLFYKDGKTASVAFRLGQDGLGVLATNGKPDASIQLDPDNAPSADESTMILAGVLPMAYAPHAKRVANIGMGSGQTAHVILGNPDIEVVDTVEIEVEMVNASRNYGEHVARVYDDPRSRIHIEDAKTYFSLNNEIYDFIIAEPSNPWVSGVSSLFSQEFYSTVRDYLTDEGLFVQWIQSYEFNDELAVSILKALAQHFDDFDIYISSSTDVILVAKKTGELGEPDWDLVFSDEIGKSMQRAGIRTPADLRVRQLANRAMLVPYLEDMPVLANSDYFPYVDLNAGKALYLDSRAYMFLGWSMAPLPVLEMLDERDIAFVDVTPGTVSVRVDAIRAADWIYRKLTETRQSDPPDDGAEVRSALRFMADWLASSQATCIAEANRERWSQSAFDIMVATLPHMDSDRAEEVVDELEKSACGLRQDPVIGAWLGLYRAVAVRDAEGMYVASRALLASGNDLPSYEREYLVNAAMLGAITAGQPKAAYDLWTESGGSHYSSGAEMPAYTKLLLSLSARFDDPVTRQAATQ